MLLFILFLLWINVIVLKKCIFVLIVLRNEAHNRFAWLLQEKGGRNFIPKNSVQKEQTVIKTADVLKQGFTGISKKY